MVMQNLITTALDKNLPLLLLGKSGWGKTSLVEQAGERLGMEVVVLSLALSLPEDIGGIPAPSEGGSFKYLLPDWFASRKNTPFVLFLDEINQATPQTLHAIYGLVHERRLHSEVNKEMRVIAAGNLAQENPHLTEIMQPLLNRFYVVDFIHDEKAAMEHLNQKYGLNLRELEFSPRDTEQGIIAFRAGLPSLAIKKAGAGVVRLLENNNTTSPADDLVLAVRKGKIVDRNGFISGA